MYWRAILYSVQSNAVLKFFIYNCYIIVHVKRKNGFVEGDELIFKENTMIGDYYDQMNAEKSEK